MIKIDECTIKQAIMAKIAGCDAATVSRTVKSMKITPVIQKNSKNIRFSLEDTSKILSAIRNVGNVARKHHCFYNFKGGVGKTSISFQISTHLAIQGYRVLAIDADPQGHLSTTLGFETHSDFYTLYDVISGNILIKDAIHNVFHNYDCLPSNLSLTRIENKLNQLPRREEQVSLILNEIKDNYDFIIFDCNPNVNHLNHNILNCSDQINIVVETQPYSLHGMGYLMEEISSFFDSMRIKAPEILVIPNKYDERTNSSMEAMAVLIDHYGQFIKKNFAIRKSEDIITSSKTGEPLACFAKTNSNALEDIVEITDYLLHLSLESNEDGVGRVA